MRRSAGLLVFRRTGGSDVHVLIGHMGGPFWARRDAGAWSVPKGEHGSDEEPLAAARREFTEELGLVAPEGPVLDLGVVRQSGGKEVHVFAVEGDLDVDAVVPGTLTLEWPARSGRFMAVPEMDRVAWLTVEEARPLLVSGQRAFLDRLRAVVKPDPW